MVVAIMRDHVGTRRHVAGRAPPAGPVDVVVVRGCVEARRQVALRANGVTLCPQLQTVRLVAVRAGDAGAMHGALHERAVLKDFAIDLAIW
jgi:hypothetical protein